MSKEHKISIRSAEMKDIRVVTDIFVNLILFEKDLAPEAFADMSEEELRKYMLDIVAKGIVDNEQDLLVVEYDNRIRAAHLIYTEVRGPLYKHRKICNIWMAASNKCPVYIRSLVTRCRAWARSRNCTLLRLVCIVENERANRLFPKIGFKHRLNEYVMEVQ